MQVWIQRLLRDLYLGLCRWWAGKSLLAGHYRYKCSWTLFHILATHIDLRVDAGPPCPRHPGQVYAHQTYDGTTDVRKKTRSVYGPSKLENRAFTTS